VVAKKGIALEARLYFDEKIIGMTMRRTKLSYRVQKKDENAFWVLRLTQSFTRIPPPQ